LSDPPPGPKRPPEDAAQGGFADDDDRPAGWLSRILWFVGLWAASVAVLGVVAYVIRAVLR
jgi:hypothetical protein